MNALIPAAMACRLMASMLVKTLATAARPPQTATFDRKTDAKRWVSETEAANGRVYKGD